ncbi:MAG TPA: toll/interleukin-1 receptor domain-containing protein [Acidisarcina sp.]
MVFISYRRERGYALAHLVNAELRSRGLRTFLDVAESDPGQFWPQAQAAIRSCRAVVLICTNGSFETREGEDWVLREINEARGLDRQIVPVFSQDFEPPRDLPAPLAWAIENNGVSMDTQFHGAAFDHLSQLVGGRKRSEQRRRVAILWVLAGMTLLLSLALGARNISRLNAEASSERKARQSANDRSEKLAKDIAAEEAKRAEEQQAAEQQQLRIDLRSKELEENLNSLDRRATTEQRAAADREKTAKSNAQSRTYACFDRCQTQGTACSFACPSTNSNVNGEVWGDCVQGCTKKTNLCKANCL